MVALAALAVGVRAEGVDGNGEVLIRERVSQSGREGFGRRRGAYSEHCDLIYEGV